MWPDSHIIIFGILDYKHADNLTDPLVQAYPRCWTWSLQCSKHTQKASRSAGRRPGSYHSAHPTYPTHSDGADGRDAQGKGGDSHLGLVPWFFHLEIQEMLGNWDGRHFGESEWFGRCVIYYRSTCETCFFLLNILLSTAYCFLTLLPRMS